MPKFLELKTCYNSEEEIELMDTNNSSIEGSSESNVVNHSKTDSDLNCTREGYKATNLRLNSLYYSIYLFWLNLIFMGIIP